MIVVFDGPRLGSSIGPFWRACLIGMILFSLNGISFAQIPPEGKAVKEEAETGDDAKSYASRYVTLARERARLEAETEFLEAETERLTGQGTEFFDGDLLEELEEIDSASKAILTNVMEKNSLPFVKGLERVERKVSDESDELEETWKSVRTDVNSGRSLLFEVTSQRKVAGRLASLLNVDNRYLWLCGAIAAFALLGVFLQQQRHYLRRLMQVRRTRFRSMMVVLAFFIAIPLIPTILIFVLGNSTYDSIVSMGPDGAVSPRKKMAAETNELAAEVEELKGPHAEAVAKYERAHEAYKTSLLNRIGEDPNLTARWESSRADLKNLAVGVAVRSVLNIGLKADLDELASVNKERAEHEESIAAYAGIKRFTGAGLGVVLLSVIGGLSVYFVRGVRRRRKRLANTCPRCLAENKLERTDAPGGGDIGDLRCTNVIRENPFEECDFRFNAHYHKRSKVAFPTLGVASSGKTHWLAMVYQQLNLGAFPEKVHFERVKTQGAAEFDEQVKKILTNRMAVAASENRIPHPLMFGFKDRDRLGKSDVLVNMFDYAGQVVSGAKLTDFQRRRALDGDGFFFFLDPTLSSEGQAEALVNFREDLKIVKKLGTGKQIHTPVALCVTKIDLLVNLPYAQGDIITDFYEQLSKIDEEEEPLSQRLIERRSELVQQLRETIWPGWQIERQIEDLFGSRFMFFPFTPVGLNELGETDLNRRTISPYGIIEPLLWLLHMNGYPVLD